MLRRWILPFLCLAGLAGCGPQETHLGGEIPAQRVRKIISLSPSTTEIVAVVGPSNDLFGRGQSDDWPTSVTQLPVFGGVKPDYEKLAVFKPDLIVLEKSLYSQADLDKLKSLGLHVFAFDANTLDEYYQNLKDYGDIVGNQLGVSQYIDKIDAQVSAARAIAPNPPRTVAVLSAGEGPDHLILGEQGFVADLIRQVGGKPIGPNGEKFVPLNPEQLLEEDPDLILLAVPISATNQEPGQVALKAFENDPRFKALKAVKNKQVYPMSEDVLYRAGARVDTEVQAIGSVLGASS